MRLQRAAYYQFLVTHQHTQSFWILLFAAGGNNSNGSGDPSLVLEGSEFRDFVVGPDGGINKAAFDAIWPRLRVLARCSPTDKYTIVQGASCVLLRLMPSVPAHSSPCELHGVSLAHHK